MEIGALEKPDGRPVIARRARTVPELWSKSVILGMVTLILVGLYLLARGEEFGLRVINRCLADTGLLLIGLSFAGSGVAYFWNFADDKVGYRKYIGLVGFWAMVLHSVISLFLLPLPVRYPHFYQRPENVGAFIFAMLALLFFTMMTVVSTQWALKQLGPSEWRAILHTGYLAYVFTILHATLRSMADWQDWVSHPVPWLPPLSIFTALFALTVLMLRSALWVAQRRRSTAPTPS